MNFNLYTNIIQREFSGTAGIIGVDTNKETVFVEKVVEKDFECHTTIKELNKMRDAINKMRIKNGEPPLTVEELPVANEDSRGHKGL